MNYTVWLTHIANVTSPAQVALASVVVDMINAVAIDTWVRCARADNYQ